MTLYTPVEKTSTDKRALPDLPQFVAWSRGKVRKNGKREKIPRSPRTGKQAKPNDPATWGTLEEAKSYADEKGLDGIGFMFTAGDGFAGVDLDECRDPETGAIDPWAWKIIEKFSSYTEVSPSGTGVKIIVRGQLPEGRNRRGPVEMYDKGRFFTITGEVLGGYKAIEDRQKALERLHTKVCAASPQKPNTGHTEAIPVPLEDQELLEKARTAGNGVKFRQLYDEGDTNGYGSHSDADMALMGMLAFWTGRDKSRMESLFSASGLGQRNKWSRRQDYRKRTVDLAASRCERTYTPKPCADSEVQRMVEAMREFATTAPWTGRRGPRARWVFEGLMNTVGGVGKACAEGVIVSESSRENALKSGTRRETSGNGFKYLEEMGVLKRIKRGRGKKASTYLVLIEGIKALHKENTKTLTERGIKALHKEGTPHPVFIYGALWSRLRDAAPESEKDFDSNGRKIAKGVAYSFNSLGAFAALVMEKIAAFPGLTRNQVAGLLQRDPKVIKRTLATLADGGFVVEKGGTYFMPDEIRDLLLDELSDSGCLAREKLLREKYDRERNGYEEYLREKRLVEVVRECGVDASMKLTHKERDGHVKEQESVEVPRNDAVITGANDPEQLKALAAMIHEGVSRHREECETVRVQADRAPDLECVEEDSITDLPDLTPEELLSMVAILAFEDHFGVGAFKWTQSGCKELFYSGPISGHWPTSDQLERIRRHVATGEAVAVELGVDEDEVFRILYEPEDLNDE